jgi:capsid protein
VKRFMSSYSAARAAINEAWKYFVSQRALVRDCWCQPVYETVIEEAVLKGRLALPGFLQDPAIRRAYLGAMWIGPGRGQINEVQEVEAAVLRIDNNLSTKAQETASLNGGDFETNVRTRRREMAAERDLLAEQQALKAPSREPSDEDDDEDEPDGPEPPDPMNPAMPE